MKKTKRSVRLPSKRRTTLTLPTDSLGQAEQLARSKGVNLSTVVAEALAAGLKQHTSAERSRRVLDAYKRAFSGFSDDEIAILDGVILSPIKRK